MAKSKKKQAAMKNAMKKQAKKRTEKEDKEVQMKEKGSKKTAGKEITKSGLAGAKNTTSKAGAKKSAVADKKKALDKNLKTLDVKKANAKLDNSNAASTKKKNFASSKASPKASPPATFKVGDCVKTTHGKTGVVTKVKERQFSSYYDVNFDDMTAGSDFSSVSLELITTTNKNVLSGAASSSSNNAVQLANGATGGSSSSSGENDGASGAGLAIGDYVKIVGYKNEYDGQEALIKSDLGNDFFAVQMRGNIATLPVLKKKHMHFIQKGAPADFEESFEEAKAAQKNEESAGLTYCPKFSDTDGDLQFIRETIELSSDDEEDEHENDANDASSQAGPLQPKVERRGNKDAWQDWEQLVVVAEWMKINEHAASVIKKPNGQVFGDTQADEVKRWDAYMHTDNNSKLSSRALKHIVEKKVLKDNKVREYTVEGARNRWNKHTRKQYGTGRRDALLGFAKHLIFNGGYKEYVHGPPGDAGGN